MSSDTSMVIPARLQEIRAQNPGIHLADALLRMVEDYDCEAAVRSAQQACTTPSEGIFEERFAEVLIAHTLVNTGWKPRRLVKRYPWAAKVMAGRQDLVDALNAGIIPKKQKGNPSPRWYPTEALTQRSRYHSFDPYLTDTGNAVKIKSDGGWARQAFAAIREEMLASA